MRRALAKRAGLAVEKAGMGVEPVRQRRRKARIEQRAFRQNNLEQIVKAFVEKHRRIERHDHVDAEEQLAEPFVDVKIDRAFGLRIGSGPVEHRHLAAPINRQRHLERTVAEPVVVDVVGKADRLLGNVFLDQNLHGFAGAVEQHVAGRHVGVAAESVAQFAHPRRGRAAAGDQAPSGRRGSCPAYACC